MKIILILILLLTMSIPTYAIGGYISLDYGTLDGRGLGEIDIHQDFNKWRIGGRFTTDLMGFNLKGGYIPAGVPESQAYDLYINYQLTEDITLTFTEGCKHYFSQSGYSRYKDNEYIKVGFKYKFGHNTYN